MPYARPMKTLRAFYVSIAITLACLAIVTQIFIQTVLYQEHLGRVAEEQIAQSAIIAQQIQQDMLIQIIPGHKLTSLNRLKAEVPKWEKTQDMLYTNAVSSDIVSAFQPVKKDYVAMESSVASLLKEETKAKPDNAVVTKYISAYFYANNEFLPVAEKIFFSVGAKDDAQSEEVHLIELAFCILTLLTIFAEVILVARPALDKLNSTLHDIQAIIDKEKSSTINNK